MKNLSKILFLSLFSTLLTAQVYVNDDATGANDGTSWADAYTDLGLAIINAPAGSQIWVAAGTYYPTHNQAGTPSAGTDATFYINKDLSLYGGLQGNETSLPTGACIDPTLSILDGDIGTPGNNSDNVYHIITTQSTSNITISGFTIQNGNAAGSGTAGNGGGMYNFGTSPTINNCIFQNNRSFGFGGAVYNDGASGPSSPIFTNVSFVNNTANSSGGAVFNDGELGTSSPIFTNVSFVNNTANRGGAVYNDGESGTSSPIFTNVSFVNNMANNDGGAVYSGGIFGISNPIFTNVSFVNNTANDDGGAVYNDGFLSSTSSIFTNAIFWGNTATNGNIFFNLEATSSIDYSLVDVANCATLLSDSDFIGSTTTCGSNMVFNQDPLFQDSANGNLRLQCASPAIDTGTATGAPAFDLENVPRPQNGLFDMGAYEGCISPVLTITTQPTNQVANCGDNASFSVTANTTVGSLTYQWQSDCGGSFANIPTETSSTLNLTNVGLSDACNYRVVVDDGVNCEIISDVVSLTVNGVPDIAPISTQTNTCPNETAFDLNNLTVTDNNSVTGTTTTFHTAAPSSVTDMTNQITGAGLMISSSQTVFVMMATGAGCFDVESFMVDIIDCCNAGIGSWN